MRRPAKATEHEPSSGSVAPTRLGAAGVVAACWAVLPPYSGPPLATEARVEVADHVVPAAVLLSVAVAVLILSSRRRAGPTGLLGAGLVVSLAGLWMTATHVPLVVQAAAGDAPWPASIYHTAPGLAVLILGFVWARSYWSAAG